MRNSVRSVVYWRGLSRSIGEERDANETPKLGSYTAIRCPAVYCADGRDIRSGSTLSNADSVVAEYCACNCRRAGAALPTPALGLGRSRQYIRSCCLLV